MSFGCPYCGTLISAKTNDDSPIDQSTVDVSCQKCTEKNQWHEGIFKIHLFTFRNKRTKSISKGGSKQYSIRAITFEGEEEIVFTTGAIPSLSSGDVIILSYPRTSKGIFTKTWTGEYTSNPSVLYNLTTKHGWKL